MNDYNSNLKDFIFVQKSTIEDYICDSIVDTIESRKWDCHSWYSPHLDSNKSEEMIELDVQYSTKELEDTLFPYIINSALLYNKKYRFISEKTEQIISRFSSIRFNRYSYNHMMGQHYDHIHSLFDGEKKGIPVLSFVLNFNDKYEGGELYFWNDYMIQLGKGDIAIFPSIFLFPHGVKKITKGKRYSAVTWAW